MTDIEEKRLQLLQETRKTYSDKNTPPAIHPRYQSAYRSLYGEKQEDEVRTRSTIWIRVLISILLFVLFYVMDYRQEEIGIVNSGYIIQEVQRDLIGK